MLVALTAPILDIAAAEPVPANPYARWTNGPPATPEFFPIAVWLQPPSKAQRYREAGFNTYVGLWKGPTEEQLAALKQAGMKVICAQNAVGLRHRDDPTIIGWMHDDEPDNAQSLGPGKGYGPPILPEKIVADYRRLRAADPSRPVLLNLGQGVAWDQYIGRGVRRNHPEDYPEYVQGCDIASFDIYPVVHDSPEIAGKLWFVARGVERLVGWAGPDKPAWNCIECTRISSRAAKATPQQVRAEVWMSLIHGSRGLIYFVHEWQPRFDESALLNDPEMLSAVAAINRQITQLAPVLNAATVKNGVTVTTDNPDVPVAAMLKHYGGATWLFTVAMRAGATTARFSLNGWKGDAAVEVLGEDRTFAASGGEFTDTFQPWQTHLYRLTPKAAR
ncbi:MAG: hypothetical protein HYZ36_06755 [Pedosphaera parvula]|nr:hypothetical protein [Verrucomicrobiota bacterium]MBI3192348.1 hypothetical protein [Pedosphaera parvula]